MALARRPALRLPPAAAGEVSGRSEGPGLSVKPCLHPFTLGPGQVEDTRDDRWDVNLPCHALTVK